MFDKAIPNSPGTVRRRRTSFVVVSLLIASLAPLGGGEVPSAVAGSRYTKRVTEVRKGLTYMRITDSQGPNRIKVLKIDPSTSLTMDVALANDELPGRERTSSMAARYGAIAAVNGNFGNSWGRPLGLLGADGSLKTSPLSPGGAFALSQDEQTPHIGMANLSVTARNLTSGQTWSVTDWNEQYPSEKGIAGYTSAGGSVLQPPGGTCSVRLVAKSSWLWEPEKMGVGKTYRVDKVQCSGDRLYPAKGIVLAAKRGTRRAQSLSEATVDQRVRVAWSTGWAGVMDAIGGSPVLMKDGQIVIEPCSAYVCGRHPRTAVGFTPRGKILLVTVDGRRSDSVGMTVVELARLFKYLGAEAALNLDGGGSATMVLKGKVVNQPSDSGGERAVVSSLLVLPGPDEGEPQPKL
jgi:Phosphodiester glycosidase